MKTGTSRVLKYNMFNLELLQSLNLIDGLEFK